MILIWKGRGIRVRSIFHRGGILFTPLYELRFERRLNDNTIHDPDISLSVRAAVIVSFSYWFSTWSAPGGSKVWKYNFFLPKAACHPHTLYNIWAAIIQPPLLKRRCGGGWSSISGIENNEKTICGLRTLLLSASASPSSSEAFCLAEGRLLKLPRQNAPLTRFMTRSETLEVDQCHSGFGKDYVGLLALASSSPTRVVTSPPLFMPVFSSQSQ